MRYLILLLIPIQFGCVGTVKKIFNKDQQINNSIQAAPPIVDANATTSSIIYNDRSASAWNVVVWLGLIIMFLCIAPLFVNYTNVKKLIEYIKSKRKPKPVDN